MLKMDQNASENKVKLKCEIGYNPWCCKFMLFTCLCQELSFIALMSIVPTSVKCYDDNLHKNQLI